MLVLRCILVQKKAIDKFRKYQKPLTGQVNHLAAIIEADIVKQKKRARNGGFQAIKFGWTHNKVYTE